MAMAMQSEKGVMAGESDPQGHEYLAFTIGDEEYGIDILTVQEIRGYDLVTRIAGAPAFIIWTAGPIELVGGALVMVGLATRWAAFLCSGLMAFAYWMAHGFNALLPLVNQGELAALYCFAFLWIAAHGPGMWSLERTE